MILRRQQSGAGHQPEGLVLRNVKLDTDDIAMDHYKKRRSASRVRLYQTTAIVAGRSEMSGQLGETPFSTSSRYTHVYVRQPDHWRMVSAQGTPISS